MNKSELVVHKNRIYHLGLSPLQIHPNMIFVGDPARAYLVAEHFQEITHEVKHREFVTLTGRYQNLPVSVIGTGIGTDNVEIALIEAYAALCIDLETQQPRTDQPSLSILRVGTSGGVQPSIAAGTMAISNYALGLDSTGLFYDHLADDPLISKIEQQSLELLNKNTPDHARFKGKIIPYASSGNSKLVLGLEKACEALTLPHVTGITVSSPGFYGPSGRFIHGLKNTIPDIKLKLAQLDIDGLKAVNMEMESSLIFHLGTQLGINCATICPIISNPVSSDEVIDYQKVIHQAIEAGLNALAESIP